MWVLLWVDVGDTAGADEWSLHVAELEALDVRKVWTMRLDITLLLPRMTRIWRLAKSLTFDIVKHVGPDKQKIEVDNLCVLGNLWVSIFWHKPKSSQK